MKTRDLFADVPEQRRRLMAKVRPTDSKPEMLVRRAAHGLGFRYRLHVRTLPGKPDLVFPRLRKVVFVHGCFWHRHPGCTRTTTPKAHAEYWQQKFDDNVRRDEVSQSRLEALGWTVLVIWECDTKDQAGLVSRLNEFLSESQ
ncbi:DNA mismatch endonuclease Vsr [Rhizobium leguminosarum]|uniref:very short patch repair endonuclease n=1 Tax=Rhizobium leguminosarum TaxID=384 RepID=UPI0014426AB8|nr:very short patch repair endonuclease [Rhizobium leguminosarum]MBY5839832.1 DNA mismatch endonuclease Vsr [Rhizobium leguminosarum]NKM82507.1 DNA mismatch endonuclease Vsr [Rhizobium leguminosarum bv. viciae]QSZ09399.1 DNA mismatch endonuclease Vsr [Rhizobium leguminosarum]